MPLMSRTSSIDRVPVHEREQEARPMVEGEPAQLLVAHGHVRHPPHTSEARDVHLLQHVAAVLGVQQRVDVLGIALEDPFGQNERARKIADVEPIAHGAHRDAGGGRGGLTDWPARPRARARRPMQARTTGVCRSAAGEDRARGSVRCGVARTRRGRARGEPARTRGHRPGLDRDGRAPRESPSPSRGARGAAESRVGERDDVPSGGGEESARSSVSAEPSSSARGPGRDGIDGHGLVRERVRVDGARRRWGSGGAADREWGTGSLGGASRIMRATYSRSGTSGATVMRS